MFSSLPVVRIPAVRRFYIATALVTVGLMAWLYVLPDEGGIYGLSLIFAKLFLFQDHDAVLVTLLLLLALMLLPELPGLRRVPNWLAERPWSVCAGTILVLSAGSVLVYHAQPLSMDEYAPVFQSQVFASGHMAGSFPRSVMDWLIPPMFQGVFLRVSPVTGQVMSAYSPSFALLLTPFSWLGIPWACNAVLSGLTVVTLRKLALELFGSMEAAGLAMLFTLASPVFFADGISFYSMTAHLLFNSVFALLLLKATPRRLLLAGVVGSVAFTLHNPLPHTLFALPWVVWLALRKRGMRDLGFLAIGYLPLGLPLLLGWHQVSTSLSSPGGETAHAGLANMMATSLMSWPTAGIVLSRFIGLAKVWIWAVPGLLLLAAAGAWQWRKDPRCVVLAASAVLTFAGYFFFKPDQGHGWGYRYFHSAWLALPLLAAGALSPRATGVERGTTSDDAALTSFVVVASLLMLTVGVGVRAIQIDSYMREHLAQLPAYDGKELRIVLISQRATSYGADLVQNDPFLRGNDIQMFMQEPAGVPAAVRALHPEFHRVFADRHGEVWSAAKSAP